MASQAHCKATISSSDNPIIHSDSGSRYYSSPSGLVTLVLVASGCCPSSPSSRGLLLAAVLHPAARPRGPTMDSMRFTTASCQQCPLTTCHWPKEVTESKAESMAHPKKAKNACPNDPLKVFNFRILLFCFEAKQGRYTKKNQNVMLVVMLTALALCQTKYLLRPCND